MLDKQMDSTVDKILNSPSVIKRRNAKPRTLPKIKISLKNLVPGSQTTYFTSPMGATNEQMLCASTTGNDQITSKGF